MRWDYNVSSTVRHLEVCLDLKVWKFLNEVLQRQALRMHLSQLCEFFQHTDLLLNNLFNRFMELKGNIRFLDEMIDNDTELIALNSKDDDIFYLISLRRNHKDHVPCIREYYEEVIPRYTDLQLDLQFRHHFRMSRPAIEQLCYCWVIASGSEWIQLYYRSTANSTSKTSLYDQKKSAFVYWGH